MHQSQITGSTSSYARKYALGALFLIDSGVDSDSLNRYEKEEKRTTSKYKEFPAAKVETVKKENLREMLENCEDIDNDIFPLWCLLTRPQQEDKEIGEWFSLRKSQIKDEENG